MAYTIGIKREREFTGNDLNNDPCIFGRGVGSFPFQQHVGLSTKRIAADASKYLAFPFVTKIGSSLIGIYSEGDTHASSDKQIMIRSDDLGVTWSSVTFYDVSTPGTFNTSLLSGLLGAGDSIVLKIWTIKNVAGTLTVYTNTSTANGGNTYAHWSRAEVGPSGNLWITGYDADVGGFGETVLLESTDGGVTWAYKSTIAPASDSRAYNECSIIATSGTTDWLAIIREASAGNLYKSVSTDSGATWSSPTLLTASEVNGTQPNLLKTSTGLIVLATGDRTGGTGYSYQGVWGLDRTGISIFVSADSGTTWSYRTNVALMSSTDGGQPQVNEISSDRVNIVYYRAAGFFENAEVASVSLNVDRL